MSLFGSLNVGMRGLHAAQVAIDVTGQNISNANTEGYSRKRVGMEADAVHDDVYGQIGLGVEVTQILRVRNEFLDRQTWEQMGDKGYYSEMDKAMVRLENILREPSEDGLSAHVDKFWSSWQDLANNPADLSAREAVKAAAATMVDVLHAVYKQIEDYGLSMNNPLQQKAKQINDITGQIYALNERVAGVEADPTQNANDTRDQRDSLIRELGTLVDVQVIEDAQGRAIITSGGNLLVGPSEALQVETYGEDKVLSDGTKSSELKLRLVGSRREFSPRSGEVKGIIDARAVTLASYVEDLNKMAKSLVEETNAIHVSGYNLNKNSGVYFFDPEKVKANDISLSDAVAGSSVNIAAAKGGLVVVESTPHAATVPAAGSPVLDLKAIDNKFQDILLGSVKVTRPIIPAPPVGQPQDEVLAEGAGKDYVVDYTRGEITFLNYAKLTAGEAIDVTFSYNSVGFPGSGNGQNALEIAQLRHKATMGSDITGRPTQSIGEYYSAVIGRLGIEKNQTGSRLETKEFLIAQMDAEQASLSGVSLDEEMANMIKFETSYQASARFITTINGMMDVLMNI
jgi:flagellar hook-associated protein 1